MKKSYPIFFLLLIFLILPVWPALSSSETVKFIKGISIHNKEVSNLTKEEAYIKLKPSIEEILKQDVILISPSGENIWLTTMEKIGLDINLEKIIEEGIKVGNEGPLLKRWYDQIKARTKGTNLDLAMELDKEKAKKEIEVLTKELLIEPEDARFVINNNQVTIKKDMDGRELDMQNILENLENNLTIQGPIGLDILTKVKKAKVTQKDLEGLKVQSLLGEYTTWFNPQKVNRSSNIRLAAKAIDNCLVPPGEEFSFNKVVGPRTKEAGYNEGTIILNKRMVQGIGGGVCQVSSTLYNALLKGNIKVTERHPHSIPIHYVPKGMDAAVVYGAQDLKFLNNTEGHILIKAYGGSSSLTIKLFGYKEKDVYVELHSIIEETIPYQTIIKESNESHEEIIEQEGNDGYIVQVERIIRDDNNNILVHEILTKDYYPPVDRIIIIGKASAD